MLGPSGDAHKVWPEGALSCALLCGGVELDPYSSFEENGTVAMLALVVVSQS